MTGQTIVIGAGLAGLSAAYELTCAGHAIQVFEAQQRLGGRTYTVPLHAGQYGELGAEFVDENHTALKAYTTTLDLKLDPAFRVSEDLYWRMNGQLLNSRSLTHDQQSALENLNSQLQLLLEHQVDPLQTLDQWLITHDIAPFARHIARRQARSLFATDPDAIGVGFFAYASGLEGMSCRVRGGSSRVAELLSQQLKQPVQVGMPVRRIQQQSEQVIVGVETPSGLIEVTAQTVIIAIPWSVLRSLSLEIPLSQGQRTAIEHLSYGGSVKTLLQYPHRFWTRSNFGIELVESNYHALWEPTYAQAGTESILSCFSGGNPSLHLGSDAVNQAKQTIQVLYPDAPDILTSQSYDWSVDLWAQGAYCYFGPGDLDRFNPHLMQPAGRIFFAGEHTAPTEYRGYMEGAIRSGQRAAQQVMTSEWMH
jgi:monoamine oxidase